MCSSPSSLSLNRNRPNGKAVGGFAFAFAYARYSANYVRLTDAKRTYEVDLLKRRTLVCGAIYDRF